MVIRPEQCLPAKARDRWIVAADLPTAIAALHHTIVPVDKWDEPNSRCAQWRQQRTERFDVRYLERLPLGMSYLTQVGRVAEVLKRPWLSAGYKFLVDETGVGLRRQPTIPCSAHSGCASCRPTSGTRDRRAKLCRCGIHGPKH